MSVANSRANAPGARGASREGAWKSISTAWCRPTSVASENKVVALPLSHAMSSKVLLVAA